MPSGTHTTLQQYGVLAISTMQFFTRVLVRTSSLSVHRTQHHDPCLVCTTFRAPGEFAQVQPQGSVLLIASPLADYGYAAKVNLSVGSRCPAHIFASHGGAFSHAQSCGTCASWFERCPWLATGWKKQNIGVLNG